MFSEIQLREELARYLNGKLSLDDFEDWFARESWNVHKSNDLGAQRMAYAVELRLSEHSNGHLPEDELRNELDQLLRSPVIVFFGQSQAVQTGSSIAIRFPGQPLAFRPADIKPLVASALQAHR